MKFSNKSDFETDDIKRVMRYVMSKMKSKLKMAPIESICIESYNSNRWEGRYSGWKKKAITIRIGRKLRWPANWDNKAKLVNWEDLFVGLLVWCLMLHYQACCWNRELEKTGKMKYHRADCQEVTLWYLKNWRVDANLKMIMEKVDVDGEAPTTD